MQPILMICPGGKESSAIKSISQSISQLVMPDEVAIVRPWAITTEVYSYKNKKLIIVEEIENDSAFYKALGHVNAICLLNKIDPLIIYTTQDERLANVPGLVKIYCSPKAALI